MDGNETQNAYCVIFDVLERICELIVEQYFL